MKWEIRMGWVTFFLVAIISTVLAMADNTRKGEKARAAVFGLVALFSLLTLTFSSAPREFGWAQVPESAESFEKRLDAGIGYQVISSTVDDKSQVLLVKKTGTANFYAIRVEGTAPPPEYFALVDGKPVALAAPVAARPPSQDLK